MTDATEPTFNTETPEPGERLQAARASQDCLSMLARRRSTAAVALAEPGPDADQLATMLRLSQRVPDHGKMTPWRFVVFQGDERERFGNILAKVASVATPNMDEAQIETERSRLTRAPLVIAVISTVIENHKIPEWEQVLSAGAVCQTMLLAANAMGFGGQWLTEWYAYHPAVRDSMGLRSGERIAGFMYFGTANEDPVERLRPKAAVDYWQG
tara:strand:- start:1783 stop:2421 length:639 start_codon:yes stop_codon:yes gene_type:complete